MKLIELLDIIQRTADRRGFSRPFVVGGVPRDRVRGDVKEVHDVDLTTQDGDAVELAFAVSDEINPNYFQLYDDGHVSLQIGKLQIDFSSHFIIPNIDQELDRLNISNHTSLIREAYSRDFTINTLLQDLQFEKIYDITRQGVNDINTGIIRTPINSDLTIGYDPKRILRALRFALKLDYRLDPDLIKSIKKYKHLLKNVNPKYLADKTNELLKLDSEKAVKLMVELGLLDVLPMTEMLGEKLIENKLLYYAFEPATNKE